MDGCHTVDGRNHANQLRLVVYRIIYKVLYIPGGCLGFLPSTVSHSDRMFVELGVSNPANQFIGSLSHYL